MNPNDEIVFLDAGMFIGGIFRSDPRFPEANPILQAIQRGERKACTSVSILSEAYAALTWVGAKPPLTPREARIALTQLLEPPSTLWVLSDGLEAGLRHLEIASRLLLKARRIHDARHAATALQNRVTHVFTYDPDDWSDFVPDGIVIAGTIFDFSPTFTLNKRKIDLMKKIISLSVFLAVAHTAHAQTVFRKIEKKLPGILLTAKVPVFAQKTPVTIMANSAISAWVLAEHNRFVKETGPPPKDSATKVYTWDTTPKISLYSAPRVVSVSFYIFSDSGGAHPNHWYRTFNYGVTNGKAKRLSIVDLFAKGTAADIKQQVTDLVLNKARLEERAAWVNDGSVNKLTNELLDSFILEKDGIRYLIGPYEFGPYAVGDFEIKLNLNELGPDFRRELLLVR